VRVDCGRRSAPLPASYHTIFLSHLISCPRINKLPNLIYSSAAAVRVHFL
jgi:hypothetical protein